MVDHVPQSQPFIGECAQTTRFESLPPNAPHTALDYFGSGHSDECICNETANEFVTYDEFAAFSLQICDKHGVQTLIPFGALTGCSIAIDGDKAAIGARGSDSYPAGTWTSIQMHTCIG